MTPAFPSQNSTYAVSESTRNIILTEFEKAAMVMEALNKGTAGLSWKRLFKKFNFFKAYQHFVMIEIMSRT